MDRAAQRHLVFVYGTLLSGESNHRLLSRSAPAGAARTAARYELADLGGYPAMIAGGATAVCGELWEVDDDTLSRLDELEGHPGFYERQMVQLDDGRSALAYLPQPEQTRGCPRIASGDWRRREPGAASR